MTKTPLAPYDPTTAKRLEDAIKRLQERQPKASANVQALKLGKLKITITSVAIEAGVSRTLIGYANCPYPLVRKKVLGLRGTAPNAGTLLRVVLEHRATIADLKAKQKVDLSLRAAVLRRMRALERAAKRAKAANERTSVRAPKAFIGSTVEFGTVHPFPRGETSDSDT